MIRRQEFVIKDRLTYINKPMLSFHESKFLSYYSGDTAKRQDYQ